MKDIVNEECDQMSIISHDYGIFAVIFSSLFLINYTANSSLGWSLLLLQKPWWHPNLGEFLRFFPKDLLQKNFEIFYKQFLLR